jgi:hypothetical protein
MARYSLDIPYRQCLIDFFDDEGGFRWHMRVLIFASNASDGRWVGITPDHEVQVIDLSKHRVIPLARSADLPAEQVRETYAFDEFEDGELDDLVRRARDLGEMLGFIKPTALDPATTGRWRISDTAADSFGEVVPDGALGDPALSVVRDDKGMVCIDIAGSHTWYAMERILEPDIPKWKERKCNGSKGIDRRILPLRRDAAGHVVPIAEGDAVAMWKEFVDPDFPLRGPKIAKEFFGALRASGQSLLQHHMDFIKKSGIPEKGGVAREHFALIECLRHFVTYDMLDGSACVGVEMVIRRIFAIEQAVARNPSKPDWEGLDMITSAVITDAGGIIAPKFATWMSTQQMADAQIMKQGRLLREERATDSKRRGGGKNAVEPP